MSVVKNRKKKPEGKERPFRHKKEPEEERKNFFKEEKKNFFKEETISFFRKKPVCLLTEINKNLSCAN